MGAVSGSERAENGITASSRNRQRAWAKQFIGRVRLCSVVRAVPVLRRYSRAEFTKSAAPKG